MKLQEKLNAIQTTLIAKKGQYNSFGKYNYRSMEDILESVKPLLEKHGCILVVSDEMVMLGDRFYIKATAKISDGESAISADGWARESLDKKGMDASQITGATSSYARKYALNGLLAIDDTKDADTMDNRVAKAHQVDTAVTGYKTASKATADDKKAYWKEMQDLCQLQDVDAIEFLSADIDMTDKNLVHNQVVKWLKNPELLRDQLINFRQQGE